MKTHARFKGTESVEDALRAIDELDGSIKMALGEAGCQLLHAVALQAPGTFFHSMRVLEMMRAAGYAQLPDEAAAVLLHDCGKLIGPAIFAENGGASGRPPVSMLAGHVDHGMHLAEDMGLSPLTMSAINEHHGTTVIQDELKDEITGEIIDPEIRYSGSRPRTMFTAVLNMTDTLEAITASRGRDHANKVLGRICEQRIDDGQFDLVGRDEIRKATQALIDSPDTSSMGL